MQATEEVARDGAPAARGALAGPAAIADRHARRPVRQRRYRKCDPPPLLAMHSRRVGYRFSRESGSVAVLNTALYRSRADAVGRSSS